MTKRFTAIDFVFEAFYSGAVGGSIVAMFFFVVDVLQGQPLFTPSLLGSIIFGGMSPDAVGGIRLDMVAYYSVLHFVAFGLVGALVTLLMHATGVSARSPVQMMLALFLFLEVGSAGFGAALGFLPVAAANLFAAAGMAAFFAWSRRQIPESASRTERRREQRPPRSALHGAA